jgi:hypothetical protein
MSAQILDFKEAKERRERELRKLDPKRQAWIKQIASQYPEWGPKEIESLHEELDAWGE